MDVKVDVKVDDVHRKEEREMEALRSMVHLTDFPQFKYIVSRISTIKSIVKVNKQLPETEHCSDVCASEQTSTKIDREGSEDMTSLPEERD